MSDITKYTISIYTENNVGLLNRVSAIFLKRHIDILSFSTSQSEIPDVFRFIVVVKMTESGVKKIEKRFGDATYHAYNGRIRAAKALLTSAEAKTNSHASIIETFDSHFPLFKEERSRSFIEGIEEFKNKPSDEEFAISFLKETEETIQWIKNSRNATIK